MKPYEDFEAIFKKYVSDPLAKAEETLKAQVNTVENGLKAEKEVKIRAYFDELIKTTNIDFLTFEQLKLNITLSASESTLKADTKDIVDRTLDDLALIETQTNKAEILVEYKKSLNVSQSIRTVTERVKAIADEQKRREEREIQVSQLAEKAAQKIESVPNFFTLGSVPDFKTLKIKVPFKMLDEVKFYLDTIEIEYEEV
jgi:hypothetical protein